MSAALLAHRAALVALSDPQRAIAMLMQHGRLTYDRAVAALELA